MGELHIYIKSVQITINVHVIQGDEQVPTTANDDKLELICDICGRKIGVYDNQTSYNRALSTHLSRFCKGYPKTTSNIVDDFFKSKRPR